MNLELLNQKIFLVFSIQVAMSYNIVLVSFPIFRMTNEEKVPNQRSTNTYSLAVDVSRN